MRDSFMLEKMGASERHPLSVSHQNVYSDVLDMFHDNATDIQQEYPLKDSLDGERAGGDMFSAFWAEAYLRHCDGERLFILANNPNTDSKNLPLLGTTLSDGFLSFIDGISNYCFSCAWSYS